MKREKEKEKSWQEKEYEMLKSIHDQVEQELYCLKKEEDILLKLIEREQNKLTADQKILLKNSSTDSNANHKFLSIKLEKNSSESSRSLSLNRPEPLYTQKGHQFPSSNSNIFFQSSNTHSDAPCSFFYTGQKYEPIQTRRSSRKDDIFKMDQELYEQDDEDYPSDQ